MANVTLISNGGDGQIRNLQVNSGTTLAEFFGEQTGDANPADYKIRLNYSDDKPKGSYVLQEGDRVTLTPRNIKGAQ